MFIERISVRYRIALGYAAFLAATFLIIGCVVFGKVEQDLYQSVDSALAASGKSIRDSRGFNKVRKPFLREFLEDVLGERMIRQNAQIVDLSGRVKALTKGHNRRALPVSSASLRRAEKGLTTLETVGFQSSGDHRLITIPVMSGSRFTGELIQVAAPLAPVKRTLNTIKGVLLLSLSIAMALSFLVGYFITARALKPVVEISKTAASLSITELSTRLKLPAAKDEIRDLTITFNGMIDRLEDAFGRLQRFSGDVSHELRTPIAVVRGEADFALRKKRTAEEYEDSLRVISKESVHMTSIIEDLLLLARAHSKSVAIQWEEIEPVSIVNGVKKALTTLMESKSIELKITNDGPQKFFGSPGYLSLVLNNIISNSIKHSPKGSLVDVYISQNPGGTLFSVADHGVGIEEEALPYIFDPFYREDTARNRKAGGTGIGLSLAKALVGLHGGDISVSSKIGHGSTFTVFIPFKILSNEEKEASKKSDAIKAMFAKKQLERGAPLTT